MKKTTYTPIAIVAIVLVIGYFFLSNNKGSQPPSNNVSNTDTSQTSGTGQKFSDQPYYSRAYLISGDTLDTNAQKALSGFKLDKQAMSDGSVKIALTPTDPSYQDQQYTLKPGEKLYLIEKTLGDDPNNQEINMADDLGVIVDSQGNIVQAPTSLQN